MQSATAAALLAAAGAALVAAPAQAHHSFAMFDSQKSVALEGTVKEFQWTNPHAWLHLVVENPAGKEVTWAIEGGSPNGLARLGWKRTTLKPGDKAIITVHPRKDGTNGGSLVAASVNGVQLGVSP